jgi:hypothetical protein
MPISPMEDCDTQHWQDVKSILEEAIQDAGYTPRLVSLSDKVSIIHQSIVTNLYEDEIVVCDVSCRNGNVMFELGLRLAFDKPVIIVKDDKTDYLFDTGPIEHMIYPRTLRFGQINKFKSDLTKKIKATTEYHTKNPDASPFLSSFGPIKTAKIETTEVSSQDLVLDHLDKISSRMDSLETSLASNSNNLGRPKKFQTIMTFKIPNVNSQDDLNRLKNAFRSIEGIDDMKFYKEGSTAFVDIATQHITTNRVNEMQKTVLNVIGSGSNFTVSEVNVG